MPVTHTHALIKRCIDCDRAAQEQLYRSYANHVMHIAQRYATDTAEAKDIVQNSFIRVFNRLATFHPEKGNFSAWISRITINEAIAVKRKKKKILFSEEAVAANSNSITNTVIGSLQGEEIRRTMDSLSEIHQVVMQMYFYDELGYSEIAEILNLKESSIRASISRARQKFIIHWKKTNQV